MERLASILILLLTLAGCKESSALDLDTRQRAIDFCQKNPVLALEMATEAMKNDPCGQVRVGKIEGWGKYMPTRSFYHIARSVAGGPELDIQVASFREPLAK